MNAAKLEGIYKVLFDTIGEGLLIVDEGGSIALANPRSCDLFGYDNQEFEGLRVEDLIPMSSRKKHVKQREDYHSNPRKRRMGENMNLQALRKDGASFDVEISLNHFRSEKKNYVVAVITDVTDRVTQQRQIQELNANLERKVEQRTREVVESQKLYSAIAKNFPNGTINVFDKELKYLFVEGLELQQLGLTKEKLIGTSYLDKISQDIRPKIEEELIQVFKGRSKDFELDHLGQIYRINAVPLNNDNQGIDKILVVEENISEQKLSEKKREEALQKERQLNEMKSRFVSMASHEFRTPLSTILSSMSLVEKYIKKGQYSHTEKHIKRVKASVAGLTEILDDFLSVERLESNKSVVERRKFDYKEMALNVVEEMTTLCKADQIIETSFDPGDWMIYSDPKILKNILYNLLSNAIKFSAEGQKINYSGSRVKNDLIIQIQDEGIGISEEDQKRLFGRFFRAKNATNIKGTGLGLNIVKKYLEMLDGKITFKSVLFKGTTFTISLPITQP